MKTGVIFDMDRTLLTLPVDIFAVRERLKAWGAPLGLDLPWRPILRDIASVPERLLAEYGEGPAAAYRDEAWGILDQGEVEAGQRAKARLGAMELVQTLQVEGVPMALVTNNGRPGALAALSTIGLDPTYFDAMVCRGETLEPKPSAQPFVSALGELERSEPLTQLICVGDAPSDVLAARALAREIGDRLAVRAIGVKGGYVTPEALRAAHPDLVVEEVAGLWDTLWSAP